MAYVVPRAPDAPPAGTELRAFLRERLPEYMVPSAFVALDAFPLTPSGKIDRKRPPRAGREARRRAPFVAPRTPREQALAEIWREVLRLEQVGVEDDFFELGGHSILATQVLSRVRRELGVELPLRALFEAPTVRALAERLHGAAAGGRAARWCAWSVAARCRSVSRRSGCGSWSGCRPRPAAYNMAEALALDGALDVEALRRALEGCWRATRCCARATREVDGQPVQDVLAPPPFALPVEDVAEAEVHAPACGPTRARPFDLAARIRRSARVCCGPLPSGTCCC